MAGSSVFVVGAVTVLGILAYVAWSSPPSYASQVEEIVAEVHLYGSPTLVAKTSDAELSCFDACNPYVATYRYAAPANVSAWQAASMAWTARAMQEEGWGFAGLAPAFEQPVSGDECSTSCVGVFTKGAWKVQVGYGQEGTSARAVVKVSTSNR